MMRDKQFGASGDRVVIEEFLEGPEVSVLSFTDGKTVVPMVSSMDHKRAGDGDTGLNTGGMGTVAPNPYYTDEVAERCMKEIFLPTIDAMNKEGRTFKGCLYFGLMITKDGPKVIEYNCRFGDPETQVVLPLLESDLLEVMMATTEGRLSDISVKFSDKHACCVIMASDGYPVKYERGYEIVTDEETWKHIYVAGAKLVPAGEAKHGTQGEVANAKRRIDPADVETWKKNVVGDGMALVNGGGRVLGLTAVADSLKEAVDAAYSLTGKVYFANEYFRLDIGQRALGAYARK
jgi:phosphoribosylamine--glycine ligase